jgi:hypothetical protein
MKYKLNVAQAVHLADQAEKLFKRAANALVRGNNSGNGDTLNRCNDLCDRLRVDAEALLKPLGIEVDYPGLYPSFKVKGYTEYSVITAISAALDNTRKAREAK